MAKLAILLLLPTLIYAHIEINIVATENEKDNTIQYFGSDIAIISDEERHSFKLHDENLKIAAEKYFGRRPNDAFVRSPTPWGDLYHTYSWAQVTRILTPQQANILSVQSKPTSILTTEFHNNSTYSSEFKTAIFQEVSNTYTSHWSRDNELSANAEISYGFKMAYFSASGKTSFSYNSRWGESVSKSQTVTVGSKSGVTIRLEPNQRVVAELVATRQVMRVKVDFEAQVDGVVAVNYDEAFKGHHFWSLDVKGLMQAMGLSNDLKSSEEIEINFYSDSRVIISDKASSTRLYSIPLKM